ncbi:MAG: head GIN domain-containing protein [Flavisolibacter sp.]
MKKFTLLFISMSLLMVSCIKEQVSGDGPLVTETRSINNFSAIDLQCSANVVYKQDAAYKVEITAQQNILDVMITEVSNNKLVIKYKNDVRVKSHDQITIVVSSPDMRPLRISGSGNITTLAPLNSSSMEMNISGSGNIDVAEITTGMIDASISGSGNMKISAGTGSEEKLRISGSGNIDMQNVVVTKATTTTSGSGESRVNASQNLDVTISGSGSVYYKGTPIINTSISGSGKVIHL